MEMRKTLDATVENGQLKWQGIPQSLPESVEIPEWHKEELEKRMQEYYKNPNEGSPWSDVKLRIIG